jgi:hypothetical protein
MSIRHLSTAVAILVVTAGCSSPSSGPTAPSAVAHSPETAIAVEPPGSSMSLPGVSGPSDVTFPPRNEPLLFRTALEAQYRDVLRRSAVNTFVDQEGTVVWTQEYLRYRVNLCSHAAAVLAVMNQIDGLGIQPTCGTTTTATFPPRNEPFDFMVQLEAKYRDGLRRAASPSFVDVEGNIVWTQEYLRYRVSGCAHDTSQLRVFDQIAGRGVGFDCARRTDTFSFTLNPGGPAAVLGSIRATNGPLQVDLNYFGNFIILACVGPNLTTGCVVMGGRPTTHTFMIPNNFPAGFINTRVYFNPNFSQPSGSANGTVAITYNPQ